MQKVITSIVIVLVIILVAAAALYMGKKGATPEPTPRDEAVQEEEQRPAQTINVKHQYKDGLHTFVGVIDTPTPCYDVQAVVLPGDSPEIKITTVQTEAEICAQVITSQEFRVQHQAPEDTQFIATVNGELVNINQFDVDADTDINEVELFIKG